MVLTFFKNLSSATLRSVISSRQLAAKARSLAFVSPRQGGNCVSLDACPFPCLAWTASLGGQGGGGESRDPTELSLL